MATPDDVILKIFNELLLKLKLFATDINQLLILFCLNPILIGFVDVFVNFNKFVDVF